MSIVISLLAQKSKFIWGQLIGTAGVNSLGTGSSTNTFIYTISIVSNLDKSSKHFAPLILIALKLHLKTIISKTFKA